MYTLYSCDNGRVLLWCIVLCSHETTTQTSADSGKQTVVIRELVGMTLNQLTLLTLATFTKGLRFA